MNFHRRGRRQDDGDAEINLIPFIDVLLVVIIFLMLSTTYSRYSELQITLPTADAAPLKDKPAEVLVSVSADGRYSVNRQPVEGRSVEPLSAALRTAAGADGERAVVIVSADALAAHQSVINVLDAARRAGLPKLTFATQLPADGSGR
ncbi:MAG: biopolymer transporter ExbD [Burkholderiaceae bacterium]|nr:biopolymer transporter ExbD [Burkholderiaceae bacterium]